jgi:hypothetical protein
VVAFWPVTASWTNAKTSTGYDVTELGAIKVVALLLMIVVVDEITMVVALPWIMVVVEEVLFVAVWPENPSVA